MPTASTASGGRGGRGARHAQLPLAHFNGCDEADDLFQSVSRRTIEIRAIAPVVKDAEIHRQSVALGRRIPIMKIQAEPLLDQQQIPILDHADGAPSLPLDTSWKALSRWYSAAAALRSGPESSGRQSASRARASAKNAAAAPLAPSPRETAQAATQSERGKSTRRFEPLLEHGETRWIRVPGPVDLSDDGSQPILDRGRHG
jgi:hypothetical protein